METLRPGDLVTTRTSGALPIRWIGQRSLRADRSLAPIVFMPGALGNTHTMRLSPQHCVLLTGWQAELYFGEPEILVPAKHLVNGDTIYQARPGPVTYLHLMFDAHQIIRADGQWCESLMPGKIAMEALDDAARSEIFGIFPELARDLMAYGPAACPVGTGPAARLLEMR